jgi:hypothetical protein
MKKRLYVYGAFVIAVFWVITLFSFTSKAQSAMECKAVDCSDVSEAKQNCIIKARCNPLISKLNKKIRDLEAENAALKAQPSVVEYSHIEVPVFFRHTVSLVGGVSKTGLDAEKVGSATVVDTDHEFDLGLQYQYQFKPRVSGLIQATVNKGVLLGAGVSF